MTQFSNFIASQLTEKGSSFTFKPESVLIPITENRESGLIRLIADKVVNEINFYHGTIQGLYKDLVDFMDEKMSGYMPKYDYNRYKIQISKPNQFLISLKNENGIGTPRDIDRNNNTIFLGRPETPEQLREIFTHESASKDKLLEEIRDRYTDESLSELWNKYFDPALSQVCKEEIDHNKFQMADELSLIYTAVSNLFKEKPVWVTETDNAKYKMTIKYIHEEVCNLVARYIKYATSLLNRDRLILRVDEAKSEIYVNGTIYSEYLDNSGLPEIVLAVILKGDKNSENYSKRYLIENHTLLKAEYDNIVKASKVKEAIKRSDSFKNLYGFGFKELWDNYITEELKVRYRLNHIELEKEISSYIGNLSSDSLEDIQNTCLHIIGDIIFKETNFSLFARKMLYYSKIMDEKGISGESNMVSLFATTDYVAEYILNQVEINKL